MADTKINGKTVDEVLKTLNDDQMKAVSILLAVTVQKELESLNFEADEDDE